MGEGHRQRLKKRFNKEGLEHFEPHNALELLLFYCIPRKDTNTIAHDLIKRFGSFSAVLDAPIADLKKVDGVGENTAIFLKMIPKICSFYLNDKTSAKRQITSTAEAGEYLWPKFLDKTKEAVYLICLDSTGKVLYSDFIMEGSVTATSITARNVAEVALGVGAVQVILAHNHPKGFALPSAQDIYTTGILGKSLLSLGIHLADHIIIANEDFVSMAESGYLKQNQL